jgi:hypothetical protein
MMIEEENDSSRFWWGHLYHLPFPLIFLFLLLKVLESAEVGSNANAKFSFVLSLQPIHSNTNHQIRSVMSSFVPTKLTTHSCGLNSNRTLHYQIYLKDSAFLIFRTLHKNEILFHPTNRIECVNVGNLVSKVDFRQSNKTLKKIT